jgi:hypothetical protein
METFELLSIRVIPFAYPYDRNRHLLMEQMLELSKMLNARWDDVIMWKRELDRIRSLALTIDRMCYIDGIAEGSEVYPLLLSCSDFEGNPPVFEAKLFEKLKEFKSRQPVSKSIRIGVCGVPPVMGDMYSFIESLSAMIAFSEVPLQFAMPKAEDDIFEQYLSYTYPYSVFGRIADLRANIIERSLDGIIHYVQSFCFRQIEDMILRKMLDVPVLTIEGGDSFFCDERQKMRIESFIEMLREKKV